MDSEAKERRASAKSLLLVATRNLYASHQLICGIHGLQRGADASHLSNPILSFYQEVADCQSIETEQATELLLSRVGRQKSTIFRIIDLSRTLRDWLWPGGIMFLSSQNRTNELSEAFRASLEDGVPIEPSIGVPASDASVREAIDRIQGDAGDAIREIPVPDRDKWRNEIDDEYGQHLDPDKQGPARLGPYPWPSELARDKWIYENFAKNTHGDLSVNLKIEAEKKHWKAISSRNQIKESARRYAKHHGLHPV